jgi:hypothetical protein
MKYLLVMALLITAFVLGVVYGPWVRERVHHIQPPRILSEWGGENEKCTQVVSGSNSLIYLLL